ncbi:hypothetical protein ACFQY0_01070 [Haloferula chungangensis]|uniref:Uncharacterized protein n=1 Tax=Haloferula chungangensis TaxID=1048331 RepID=A0ABW2L2E9_9BACT
MKAKSFGLTSSSFIPQSDFTAQQNEGGRWTATQSFLVLQSAMDVFTGQQRLMPGVAATALDPDLPDFYQFLKFQSFEIRHMEAGWATIDANYVGFWSAGYGGDSDELPTTYTLGGSIEEESILSHPKVVALSSGERQLLAAIADGTVEWDAGESKLGTRNQDTGEFVQWDEVAQVIVSPDAVFAADRLSEGVVSYKIPRFSWTMQEESTSPISTSRVNNLGKIDNPEGDPIEPNGSRNWMLVAADSVQNGTSGAVYSNTLTWLLSDRDGWDNFLYGDLEE